MNVNELTHQIIGSAMQVHKVIGNGFQEIIYQRALAIELAFNGLNLSRKRKCTSFTGTSSSVRDE